MNNKIEVDRYYLERLEYNYKQRGYKIDELKEKIHELEQKNEHSEMVIRTELEPRIERERSSYDSWVTTDWGAEASEAFADQVYDLYSEVEDNPNYYDWEDKDGDLAQKVLWVIKKEMENGEK